MSALEKPFFDFSVECPGCNFGCNVRIWNGVESFAIVPDVLGLVGHNKIVSISMCTFDWAQTAIGHAFTDGPHTTDLVLIWAENQKTFDLLVKLAKNYHQLTELDDGDDEGDEHPHHGKPH